jgi:predicted DNA-binding protein (MmcQ/YjbR family)
MDIESFRQYCLSLPAVTEELPFGPDTLVYKVAGKMFALTDINTFESINLKCDPDLAVELRERYPAVLPGYHMNKKHWNTVLVDGTISHQLIRHWIRQSYDLVVASLPRATREKYGLT